MAKVCKFYKEKKQVSYDCETWQDVTPPEYRQGDLYEEYSSDCGWGSDFLYRWVDVEGDYMCNGYDKYTKKRQEVSYDNGVSWDPVPNSDRIGELVERFSSDCCQLRTVTGEACAEDYRHLTLSIEEASLDGETWVQTGCYTVDSISDPYALECISGECPQFISVPMSAATVYSEYINDKDNLIGYYDDYIKIHNGKCYCGHIVTVYKDMLPGEVEGQKLRKVIIPETCITLAADAFRDIDTITEVTIISKSIEGGDVNANLANQFAFCDSLTKVTFPDDYFGTICYRMFYMCPNLTEVNLGNPRYIGAFAFSGTSLTTVYLGNAVTGIGGGAFATPTLTDVYIGQKENIMDGVIIRYNNPFTPGVRIHVPCEAYGFWYKTATDYPNLGWNIEIWGDSGCTEMRWVESGTTCIGYDKYLLEIEQIKYGDYDHWFDTGNERTGALVELNSLDCGYIPVNYKVKVEYSDGRQYTIECTTSPQITRDELYSFSDSAFTKCWFGECVTSLGERLFYDNVTINDVYLPSGVTVIPSYCFYRATGLTSVVLNNINVIAMRAFKYCRSLSAITIPASIQYIEAESFTYCNGLQSITCLKNTPPELRMFGQTSDWFDITNNCPIYVPAESVDAYKSASGWSRYASRIQPIP